MKNLNKTLMLCSLMLAGMLSNLIACAPANKTAKTETHDGLGKSDGGGGDDQKPRSTTEQVTKTINSIKNEFLPKNEEDVGIWDNAGMTGGPVLKNDIANIKTPALKNLLVKMTQPKKTGYKGDRWDFDFLYDLKNSQLDIRTEGPCKDADGTEKDASTKFQPQATICFSIPRLRLIPPLDLKARITALLMHELSHHFGADEVTAVLLQNYYYDEVLTQRTWMRNWANASFLYFGESIQKILKSVESEDSKAACEIYRETYLKMNPADAPREIYLKIEEFSDGPTGQYKNLSDRLHKELTKAYDNAMGPYCEDATESEEKISKEQLLQQLHQIMENYENLKAPMMNILPSAY